MTSPQETLKSAADFEDAQTAYTGVDSQVEVRLTCLRRVVNRHNMEPMRRGHIEFYKPTSARRYGRLAKSDPIQIDATCRLFGRTSFVSGQSQFQTLHAVSASRRQFEHGPQLDFNKPSRFAMQSAAKKVIGGRE
jgi:hypothetical protein